MRRTHELRHTNECRIFYNIHSVTYKYYHPAVWCHWKLKNHFYFENSLGKAIKNSCEVINKLKSRGFRVASLSTYDFSTLYTTLPHNLIKDKLVDLIERIFQREVSLYITCNNKHAFFTSDAVKYYNRWPCQKVCEALTFL